MVMVFWCHYTCGGLSWAPMITELYKHSYSRCILLLITYDYSSIPVNQHLNMLSVFYTLVLHLLSVLFSIIKFIYIKLLFIHIILVDIYHFSSHLVYNKHLVPVIKNNVIEHL
jgi:hypothetical protein